MTSESPLPLAARQLIAVVSDLVGRAADAAVALDPVTSARLLALEEQHLRLEVELPSVGMGQAAARALALTFTVSLDAGRIRLRHHADPADAPPAHAIVSGPASALLLFLGPGRSAAPLPAELRISGDVGLVEALKALASGYVPDIGGPLQQVLGPRAATGFLNAFELVQGGLRAVLQMGADVAEDAARRVFADRPLTASLLDELDDLRLLVDRVEARVQGLEQRKPSV